MNDDMLRLSPAEMIKELARAETRKGICRVEARLEGLPEKMELQSMRDLSLIMREAVGNAVKHGGAKKIAIAADPAKDGWLLRIANDGAPFDPSSAPGPTEGHFGVEGIRQRARRLGAKVSYERRGGWTVLVLEGKKK
jgi:signal transduction histidine kinase